MVFYSQMSNQFRCFMILNGLFQSECRILLQKHANENLVLQAVMDEFEESREKGNLTAEILNREKVQFYIYYETIFLVTY